MDKDKIMTMEEFESKHEFIWGIPAYNEECNLSTINDFEIIYHKDEQKYTMFIETIYEFVNPEEEKNYLIDVCDKFTDWMDEKGYDRYKKISFNDLFYKGYSHDSEFDSIEDLYATFAMLVRTYVGE